MIFKRYPVDSLVQVLWGESPYLARVLKVEGDFHWITYPGYDESYNEWVLSDRILESNTAGVVSPNRMTSVMVEWNGRMFPAVVLDRNGDAYRVHYLGWDGTWDEWVPASRVQTQVGPKFPSFLK
jgi:hypothetical protein